MKCSPHRSNASAVTGIGLFCALGTAWDECVPALLEAEPAFSCKPDETDAGAEAWAGWVPEFALEPYIRSPKTYLDPHSRMTLAAVGQALQTARATAEPATATGILLGTALGNLTTAARFFEDAWRKGPRLVKPMLFPHAYANSSVSLAAMEWALEGPHQCLTSGATASGQALLAALDAHREGHPAPLLAGGVDVLHAGFTEPVPAGGAEGGMPLPFDPASPGVLPGEAGVMLMLHPAQAGEVMPRGWLLGGAIGAATAPEGIPDRIVAVIQDALKDAGCTIEALAFACVSADGDPRQDALLAAGLGVAVRNRSTPLPLLAPACLYGRVGGAADALLGAMALAVFAARELPAAPDTHQAPGLPCGLVLPRTARPFEAQATHALTLNVAPEGALCALVWERANLLR